MHNLDNVQYEVCDTVSIVEKEYIIDFSKTFPIRQLVRNELSSHVQDTSKIKLNREELRSPHLPPLRRGGNDAFSPRPTDLLR